MGFPDTQESDRVFGTTDFRNGVSVPLRDPCGALVGIVHTNTKRSRVDVEMRSVLMGLRAPLAQLATAWSELETAHLTRREREVLRLMQSGDTNSQMARKLFLAERTVATHIENILRKTGTRNRLEAAMWACRVAL